MTINYAMIYKYVYTKQYLVETLIFPPSVCNHNPKAHTTCSKLEKQQKQKQKHQNSSSVCIHKKRIPVSHSLSSFNLIRSSVKESLKDGQIVVLARGPHTVLHQPK